MSEAQDRFPQIEPVRDEQDTSHERIVERPGEWLQNGKVTFEVGGGGDTGWRQIFPVTYDIPLDKPAPMESDEPETPGSGDPG